MWPLLIHTLTFVIHCKCAGCVFSPHWPFTVRRVRRVKYAGKKCKKTPVICFSSWFATWQEAAGSHTHLVPYSLTHRLHYLTSANTSGEYTQSGCARLWRWSSYTGLHILFSTLMHLWKCLLQPLRTLWSRWGTPGGWSLSQAWARPTATSRSAWWRGRGRGISGRRASTPQPRSRWKTSWSGRRRSQQVLYSPCLIKTEVWGLNFTSEVKKNCRLL